MNIVENQRASFQSQALGAMKQLVPTMFHLSEPERAAFIALLAAATATPIDVTLLGVKGDAELCAGILDGVLARGDTPNSWKVGSGCCFVVSTLPGEGDL